MTAVFGINPRTGTALPPVADETPAGAVNDHALAAFAAAPAFAAITRAERANLLGTIADGIESRRPELVEIAGAETGFGATKLQAELTRAAYQFRFFADVITEGSYLEATLDPAADTPMGPRPDLRRMLVALGPIAVFGSSNFPFAFSVLGGDTASALAAGNPVVVKAHPSHPGTSQLSFAILAEALSDHPGVIAIVHGTAAGGALVAHPAIKAVGFTGSLAGGKALLDIIASRDEPIPFYGELSSINPVVVTPRAAADIGEQIGAELVASFTLGSGQLCTKPGFVLVPTGPDGDRVVATAQAALAAVSDQVLLNTNIHAAYARGTADLAARPDLRAHTGPATDGGFSVAPMFFETPLADLDLIAVHEVFGPVTIIGRYPSEDVISSVATVFNSLPNSLTATIHFAEGDDVIVAELSALAATRAGRLVYNGFPTGVAVSWAQHHGGPWPSTNSIHTSVGATALRRFLRPITYQNAPQWVLPAELRDDCTAIPRRIDGRLAL